MNNKKPTGIENTKLVNVSSPYSYFCYNTGPGVFGRKGKPELLFDIRRPQISVINLRNPANRIKFTDL